MSDYTSLPEMPPEDVPYAVASHIAYEYYYDGDPVLTQDKLTSMMDTYSLDNELSNDVGVVLKNNNDNSAILAYRGTDPTNIYDLNADAQLATGLDRLLPFQTRLSRAEDMYNSVKNVYPNIVLSGHSLGSYLADYISRENNEKAIIFNPGLTPLTTYILPPVGKIKPIVYETDNFDILSHSVHNRVYSSEVDLRTITQRENLTEWIGSHNVDSFLPKSRHIVNENDTLEFPKFKPHFGKPVLSEQPKISINTDIDICKNEPYNVLCKKKVKLNKRINRLM
tara:strand:+ start:945 stop:1787 length:843 start_codon:yes stop_codon:yes gene_type:complete